MIVIPAVDLREGRCVQLVGGSYEREIVSLNDPVAAAERWDYEGFESLHVVDLDAATGRGANTVAIQRIIDATTAEVQVGGGVRSDESVVQWLEAGAIRVVIGTRAVEDREWISRIASANPGRIIVALDVRDRSVLTRGWQASSGDAIERRIAEFNELPLAGILVTAVGREGLMEGPDVELMAEVVGLSTHPIQASGGVASIDDVRSLSDAGVSAVIIGMALYTGALSSTDLVEAFGR